MSRLDVLIDARKWAAKLGAVKNGYDYFDFTDDAEHLGLGCLTVDLLDHVCGVCVVGAIRYAQVAAGIEDSDDMWAEAEAAATVVSGKDRRQLNEEITEGGTPYVLLVLDRMIAEEAAAVTSDPAHTFTTAA